MGAIVVLILYILIFSLVGGTLLYQQEFESALEANLDPSGDAQKFKNVPAAFQQVAQLLVGNFDVATTATGVIVIASLGLFKNIIFLLPINKIKEATNASNKAHEKLDKLKLEVEVETALLHSRYDRTDWANNYHCPVVRVEVAHDTDTSLAAVGMLNVPIMETSKVQAHIIVPLHGSMHIPFTFRKLGRQ